MADGTRNGLTGDLIVGGLVALVGIVILGHTVLATTVSLLFMGWLLLIGGLVTLGASLLRIGREGFWIAAIGGGLMTVLGLVFLRNTAAAALTVTLVAGALFLTTGLARLAAAFGTAEGRLPLLIAGSVSTLLGLVVLFNLFAFSLTFLGVILGLETLSEGIAIMVVGRSALASRRAGGVTPTPNLAADG